MRIRFIPNEKIRRLEEGRKYFKIDGNDLFTGTIFRKEFNRLKLFHLPEDLRATFSFYQSSEG